MKLVDPVTEYKEWLLDGANVTEEAQKKMNRLYLRDSRVGRADATGLFRGSLIGDPCDRRRQLSYLGAKQGRTDMKYAAAGTFSHYRWQSAGLSRGFIVDVERTFRYGGWFRGSCDGVLSDGRLFELKTTDSNKLAKFQTIEQVPQQHIDQVQVMLGASMHSNRSQKFSQAVLVYEGRGRLELTQFIIDYDEERFFEIRDRVRMLRMEADLGGLQPVDNKICPPGSWIRDNCQFKGECLDRHVRDRMASLPNVVGRPE